MTAFAVTKDYLKVTSILVSICCIFLSHACITTSTLLHMLLITVFTVTINVCITMCAVVIKHYCFLTQSGHSVLKWALFNFVVFHSKFVALLFSSIYVLSEVLVVNHGSFQMQRIFFIFQKTTIIKSAHFETGCLL